uniref:Uncharacterized protein n=1 Tax=Arundo donax TaxID=35708 RepID=A0A0A9CQE2_ARUDO
MLARLKFCRSLGRHLCLLQNSLLIN